MTKKDQIKFCKALLKNKYSDKIVKFSYPHKEISEKQNCQLFLAVTGSKAAIRQRLKEILASLNDSYGKPKQGKISCGDCDMDVITPWWNGEKY